MLSMKNIQIAPGISGLFRKTAITLAAAGMAAAIAISGIIAPAPAGAAEPHDPPPSIDFLNGLPEIECPANSIQETSISEMKARLTQSRGEYVNAQAAHKTAEDALNAHNAPTDKLHTDETSGSSETTTSSAPLDAEGQRLKERERETYADLIRAQDRFNADYAYLLTIKPADPSTFCDTLPPPLPRGYPTTPEEGYDPAAAHPETYEYSYTIDDAEYVITAAREDGNLVIQLGNFPHSTTLTLSVWIPNCGDDGCFSSNPDHIGDLFQTTRSDDRRTITVSHSEDANPAQTRFRLDGTINGLTQNLVLGYLDLHTD